MVKLIRYVVGSIFILFFVVSVLEGVLLLLPNSPFNRFLQGPSGSPFTRSDEFTQMMTQFMRFGQLAGIMSIIIGVLCLMIGLVVLFARVRK